jgi:hypothetical protein
MPWLRAGRRPLTGFSTSTSFAHFDQGKRWRAPRSLLCKRDGVRLVFRNIVKKREIICHWVKNTPNWS